MIDWAKRLADLWSDEGCDWKLIYDGTLDGCLGWRLDLEWTTEHDENRHHADWATFVWQIYADSPDEAIEEAVQWCEQLLSVDSPELAAAHIDDGSAS